MVMGGIYTCTPGRRARRQGTPFGRQPNRCPSFAPHLADSPAKGEVCVCHRSAGERDARLIEWSSRDKFWRGMAVRRLRPVDFSDVFCARRRFCSERKFCWETRGKDTRNASISARLFRISAQSSLVLFLLGSIAAHMGPTCPWGNPEVDGIVILVVPSLFSLNFLNLAKGKQKLCQGKD